MIIDDLTARKLASEWHSGMSSPLYALASTGAIMRGIYKELDNTLYCQQTQECIEEIKALTAYVRTKGYRGRQQGWTSLNW